MISHCAFLLHHVAFVSLEVSRAISRDGKNEKKKAILNCHGHALVPRSKACAMVILSANTDNCHVSARFKPLEQHGASLRTVLTGSLLPFCIYMVSSDCPNRRDNGKKERKGGRGNWEANSLGHFFVIYLFQCLRSHRYTFVCVRVCSRTHKQYVFKIMDMLRVFSVFSLSNSAHFFLSLSGS